MILFVGMQNTHNSHFHLVESLVTFNLKGKGCVAAVCIILCNSKTTEIRTVTHNSISARLSTHNCVYVCMRGYYCIDHFPCTMLLYTRRPRRVSERESGGIGFLLVVKYYVGSPNMV